MDLNKQEDSRLSGTARQIPMRAQSSRSTGQACLISETSRKSIGQASEDLTLSVEVSPARTSATQEKEPGSLGKEADCGRNTPKRLGYYDQDTSSLRTFQRSLAEDSMLSLQTLPRAGMMRNGIVFQLKPSAPLIEETERSSWPTPTAAGCFTDKLKSSQQKPGSMHSVNLSQKVQMFPTPTSHQQSTKYQQGGTCLEAKIGGKLNPRWVEWLMGYPIGYTELNALETQLFRKLRNSSLKESKKERKS